MYKKIKYSAIMTAFALSVALNSGCKKYLDLPLPTDRLAADGAYVSDAAAGAVLSGIMLNASTNGLYGFGTGYDAIGFRTSLYTDDLMLLNPSSSNATYLSNLTFYTDNVSTSSLPQWSALYKQIYLCNLAIEGVNGNKSNLPHSSQWLGEAMFFRAFSYLDLVGLYGDVPLTTSSDYQVNNVLARRPKAEVYTQIISDLKAAEGLLGTAYIDGASLATANRLRPNQFVAAALLARVYLYTGDWANAEAEATKVIGNTTLYSLVAPSAVFLANSRETLIALAPYSNTLSSATPAVVRDYSLYNNGMPATGASATALAAFSMSPISQALLNQFEPNDTRFTNWVRPASTTAQGTFYFPNKYKSSVPGTEYNILFRLAEQYLIRAEARAKQNNLSGAQADINTIRNRAGLGNTTAASQADLLNAIMKERRVELFTEWGHRYYDLKRTGTLDAAMTAAVIEKSANVFTNTPATWSSFKQYWPIPNSDIVNNPNLTQTPGY